MANIDDGSDVPTSPMPGTSLNYGSPSGSGPDLDGMGHRSIDAQFKELRDILLPLTRGFADFDNYVKTIMNPWGLSPPELPVLNRQLMAWLPRWRCLQHWNRMSTPSQKMSALSLHVYARLKQMQPPSLAAPARQALGTYWDIAMAPQPPGLSGPMARGHLMTIEIRDVGSILSQALKMNMREVPSYSGSRVNSTTLELRIGSITFWEKSNIPVYNKPVRLHCKAGSLSARLVFVTRAKCQDFVALLRDDGIPYEVDSRLTKAEPVSRSANLRHLKNGKLENNLRPCGKFWLKSSKFSSLKEMTQVLSLSLHLTPVHKFQASRIEETGVGKPVFKLAPFGSGQLFTLVAPDLRFSCIPDGMLQQVISQASTANV